MDIANSFSFMTSQLFYYCVTSYTKAPDQRKGFRAYTPIHTTPASHARSLLVNTIETTVEDGTLDVISASRSESKALTGFEVVGLRTWEDEITWEDGSDVPKVADLILGQRYEPRVKFCKGN